MSDYDGSKHWVDCFIRSLEKRTGRTVTTEERAKLESQHRQQFLKEDAEIKAKLALLKERWEFKQKLRDRQGAIIPDFDALYRRKTELDGEKP